MKLQVLAALGLMAGTISKAQPVYNWGKSIGSTDFDYVAGATSDASGNVYVTGQFNGTVDFDPGPGTDNHTSTGDDTYICKFDGSGNLVWAKSFAAYSQGIAVDAAGNVYTTGVFGSTVDFDPGPGTYNLTYAGIVDVYVQKLDASGNFVWARALGGTGHDTGKCIAVDATGNVYTTGTLSGTVDMDPGPGTQPLTGSSRFISKLDTDGNYVWAKGFTSIFTNSIALDAAGDLYLAGYFFDGTGDFDPGAGTVNLPQAGGSDIFLSKIDASGNFAWAKSMGGPNNDVAKSLAFDPSGNIYLTGSFQGTADFDPDAPTNSLSSQGGLDIFITKLDAAGSLLWAKGMGGADKDEGFSIDIDASGNVYTLGNFQNTADFDPNAGTQQLTSEPGVSNIFISKLDATGNYVWAFQIGGVANESFPPFLMENGEDNVFVAGNYWDVIDFDPTAGTQTLTSAGDQDVFIVNLVPVTLPLTLLQFQAESNGSNVQLQWQTTQEEHTASFVVERSMNGKSFTTIGSVAAANTSFKNNYTFTDAQPVNGTGFYRLKMLDIDGKFTYSRMVSVRRENNAALLLSPNPAVNTLYVQATGNEPVTVQISDVNGRILQQQKVTLNGNTSFAVNIQQLLPGNYYILVKGKELKLAQAFLKK
jgi:hypothetical protein